MRLYKQKKDLQAHGRLWWPSVPWHGSQCGQGHRPSEATCLWPPFVASCWPMSHVMGADKVLKTHAAVFLKGRGHGGHGKTGSAKFSFFIIVHKLFFIKKLKF